MSPPRRIGSNNRRIKTKPAKTYWIFSGRVPKGWRFATIGYGDTILEARLSVETYLVDELGCVQIEYVSGPHVLGEFA